MISPATWLVLVAGLAAVGILWGMRLSERARQRRESSALQALSEDIFTARSIQEVHRALTESLSSLFDVGKVAIYAHNQAGQSLNALAPLDAEPAVLPLGDPRSTSGLRHALLNRQAIFIEDPKHYPCPVLWLPMTAEGETTGVLECRFSSFGRKPSDSARRSLQHLANQVAIALLLLEQRQMREEILRGERLGAALELLSGIALEIRGPMERIQTMVRELRGAPREEIAALESEAEYARRLLERLVSFGRGTPSYPVHFDLSDVVQGLVEFRRDAWRLLILEPSVPEALQQLPVFGIRGHIEQALLGLLVHAEQSLRTTGARQLGLSTEVRQGKGCVAIEFAAPFDPTAAGVAGESGAMSLPVVRAIIESHSGSLTVQSNVGTTRIEMLLPLTGSVAPPVDHIQRSQDPPRMWTLLVCSCEEEQKRELIEIAGAAGYRAVPAASTGEALELMKRFRFDAVVASSQLTDLHWSELYEQARGASAGFILMDATEAGAPAGMPVLRTPLDRSSLDAALARLSGG